MVRRARAALRRAALTEAARLRRQGMGKEARVQWQATRSDLSLLALLTPHWFRHLLAATLLVNGDLGSTMEQGGWRDARSVSATPQRAGAPPPANRANGHAGHVLDTRPRSGSKKWLNSSRFAGPLRNLAKVGVGGSNPLARSRFSGRVFKGIKADWRNGRRAGSGGKRQQNANHFWTRGHVLDTRFSVAVL